VGPNDLEILHTKAALDALERFHRSNNRYMERDMGIPFQDCFLVRAIDSDPHAAWQIHEATGFPLHRLYDWHKTASYRRFLETVPPQVKWGFTSLQAGRYRREIDRGSRIGAGGTRRED
jgi:hypothetical protein